MRATQLGLGVGVLALSGFVAFEASDYSYMTSIGPGPGFFPLWLAGALAILACGHLLGNWRARSDGVDAPPVQSVSDRSWAWRPAVLLFAMGLAAAALETAGFCLAILGLNLAIVALMGRFDRLGLAFAVSASLVPYHVFSKWLDVPLPKGWFGW
jgi:putative tricarboxylic transport membrane protein